MSCIKRIELEDMQETIDYFNITPNFKEKVEGLELPLEQ